ncbi:unnamed protein product [Callosobruchus maculatus]|uniref:Uncharacterized protein n=1 Tax=Callosobruchus maculatus TaxID=64391 RepID=A0A653BE05_CALMS|nr:unnamed protein product [Callosobruchus maculatus]
MVLSIAAWFCGSSSFCHHHQLAIAFVTPRVLFALVQYPETNFSCGARQGFVLECGVLGDQRKFNIAE